MIDFQSSANAEGSRCRPCYSPSPGGDLSRLGSGERNLAEPKVAWRPSTRARTSQRRDGGELNCSSGRQPALVKMGHCRKARCSRAVLPYSLGLNLCASVPRWQKSVFVVISIRLPRSTWWLNSLFQFFTPINSQPKSTLGYPKSTVDLGLVLLIWVKNGLPTPPLPDSRHSFRPTMTRELWGAGQIQTDTDQKRNACQTMGRGQSLSSFKTF